MTAKLNVHWWYNFVSFVTNISKPIVKKLFRQEKEKLGNLEHRQLKTFSLYTLPIIVREVNCRRTPWVRHSVVVEKRNAQMCS
jgi:hypothetical protein